MDNRFIRVAAIHDISCFGRCSLNVIIPVLSSMGIETCPVPSAVLSTHTGGFGEVALCDLTDFLDRCLEHWKTLNLNIDSIYSGFLFSARQTEQVAEYIKTYPNALVLVDPVMGDNGRAYRTCSPALQAKMRELIEHADIITPNITEAAILLKKHYPTNPLTVPEAKQWLKLLADKGPQMVVITGVSIDEDKLSSIGYDKKTGQFWRADNMKVPINIPGTGDIYACTLLGKILQGHGLDDAMSFTGNFVEQCIKYTFSHGTDIRQGIMLEAVLGHLLTSNKNYICQNF